MTNTALFNWITQKFEQPKPPVKENFIKDHLALRYERILRLRELARKEASRKTRDGEPYNINKLTQADHLLVLITQRLNDRPIFHNYFNMN